MIEYIDILLSIQNRMYNTEKESIFGIRRFPIYLYIYIEIMNKKYLDLIENDIQSLRKKKDFTYKSLITMS